LNTPSDHNSEIDADQQALHLVLWALAALKLDVAGDERGVYSFAVPAQHRDVLGGAERVSFSVARTACDGAAATGGEWAEQITPESRLFGWVTERLGELKEVPHAAPSEQPVGVHQLTANLFRAYTVDGGHVHLGGCRLDDRPVLRLTYRLRRQDPSSQSELIHEFVGDDHRPLDKQLVESLHLDRIIPLPASPRKSADREIELLVAAGKKKSRARQDGADVQLIASVIIWCKYAHGRTSLTFGDETASVSFEGWARLLADGQVMPPAFACPETGIESYHVAATDDGRITAAESIAVCEESQRRMLATELQTCEVTGRRVLPEYMKTCCVSEQRVLASAMTTCSMCRQSVCPTIVKGGRCKACRRLKSVTKADPRMARVLGEYPGLDRWRSWKMSETRTVYILMASSLLRRLLVVLGKEPLDLLHLATSGRVFSGWTEVPQVQREELLR